MRVVDLIAALQGMPPDAEITLSVEYDDIRLAEGGIERVFITPEEEIGGQRFPAFVTLADWTPTRVGDESLDAGTRAS